MPLFRLQRLESRWQQLTFKDIAPGRNSYFERGLLSLVTNQSEKNPKMLALIVSLYYDKSKSFNASILQRVRSAARPCPTTFIAIPPPVTTVSTVKHVTLYPVYIYIYPL